jgi:hypothetical protein
MIFRRESCILRLGSLIDVNCCDSGPSAVLILSFLQGPGFHPGACPGVSFLSQRFAAQSNAAHANAADSGRIHTLVAIRTGGYLMEPAIAAVTRKRIGTAALPPMTPAQVDFLSQLATHLGLSPAQGAGLVAPRLITGPSGFMCRLQLMDGQPAVRTETLLPLSSEEVMGAEVRHVLSVQSLVLAELGWYLGTSSEGLLQIESLAWIDSALDAATALDIAAGLGTVMLQALLYGEAAQRTTLPTIH